MMRKSLRRCASLGGGGGGKGDESFDAIVIGGGVSGCVLASKIARENMSTLLIEAGADITRRSGWTYQMGPTRYIHRLRRSGYETGYDTTPQRRVAGLAASSADTGGASPAATSSAVADARAPVRIPAPHVLGGAGIMGPRTWILGDAADWDGFLDYGALLRPKLRNLEQLDQRVIPAYRGKVGKWVLSRSLSHSPYYKPFSNMLIEEFKVPLRATLNADTNVLPEGVARAEVNYNAVQQRASTTLDQLTETQRLRRPLTVRCNTEAAEINFTGSIAEGVTTADGTFIRAGFVVLAAGAIGTPRVLLNSPRLAPAAAEHVGKGFWDAPQVVLQYATRDRLSHHCYADPLVQLMTYFEWRRGHVSAASSSFDDMVCFWASGGAGTPVDTRIMIQPFLLASDGTEGGRHGFQVVIQLIRPRSRGSISLEAVDPNYLADPADAAALETAVRRVKEGIAKHMKSVVAGDGPIAELFESAALAGGSCAINSAVEYPSFALKGYNNVYVCDSSVLPRPLGGDYAPNLAVLAEHAIEGILNVGTRGGKVAVKQGKIA